MAPASSPRNVRSVKLAPAQAAACPDIPDRLAFLARQEHLEHPASPDVQANLADHRLSVPKCQFHHASRAHQDHQAQPDPMASQEHQDSQEPLASQATQDHQETQDHRDHPAHPAVLARTDHEASQANQPSAHPTFPAIQEHQVTLDPPEPPEMLDHQARMATQDNRDHPDPLDSQEHQAPMASQAHPVPKAHPDHQESQESVPSTAPPMVVSSTRMARNARHKLNNDNHCHHLQLRSRLHHQ